MELDDLKQTWKQSADNIKPINNNIMEMIQNKSYGPVAMLKRRFKKQLIVLPLVVLFLIYTLSKHHDIFSDVLFWFYISICIVMCSYFYFNYRILSKVQQMDDMVKSNLEKQVHLLEQSFTWRLWAMRIALVVFMVLLELLLHFKQEPSMVKWANQPLPFRLLCYAGLFVAFYFFSKVVVQHKYGKHLLYLKSLIQQMQ